MYRRNLKKFVSLRVNGKHKQNINDKELKFMDYIYSARKINYLAPDFAETFARSRPKGSRLFLLFFFFFIIDFCTIYRRN